MGVDTHGHLWRYTYVEHVIAGEDRTESNGIGEENDGGEIEG